MLLKLLLLELGAEVVEVVGLEGLQLGPLKVGDLGQNRLQREVGLKKVVGVKS